MEEVKRIPYGVSNFVEVVEQNQYYVDKTMYLPLLERQPNYLFLIRKASPGKRQEISVLFFLAQGRARTRKFIIISGRTVSLLSKRKLRWK